MAQVDIELGQLVREARLKADLTQLELSVKLGYESMQFVSLFERGLSKIPLKVLGKLVIILKIPEKKVTKMLLDHLISDVTAEIKEGKEAQLKCIA